MSTGLLRPAEPLIPKQSSQWRHVIKSNKLMNLSIFLKINLIFDKIRIKIFLYYSTDLDNFTLQI